jgi:predicted dehydrogenase
MNTIKVGILGAGRIAGGFDDPANPSSEKVFTHLGAYRRDLSFKIEAIFDIQPEAAEQMAKVWNIEKFLFDSVEDFLALDLDVISICTPDETHFECVKRCLLGSTAKVIFVEKPVAQELEQIETLIQLSQKTKKRVVINFQRQFDGVLNNFFKQEKAELLLARAIYYKGLSHIGSTMLDLLIRHLGYPVSVSTFQENLNRQIREKSYDFVLFYENNLNVVVSSLDKGVRDYNYHIFDLELFYSDKKVNFTYNTRYQLTYEVGDYDYADVKILDVLNPKIKPTGYDLSLANAMQQIAQILRSNSQEDLLVSLTHSYNIRLLVEYIMRSSSLGRPLTIEKSRWK